MHFLSALRDILRRQSGSRQTSFAGRPGTFLELEPRIAFDAAAAGTVAAAMAGADALRHANKIHSEPHCRLRHADAVDDTGRDSSDVAHAFARHVPAVPLDRSIRENGAEDLFRLFKAEGGNPAGMSGFLAAPRQNDPSLSVSSITVNEGSPYAIFTVSGAADEKVLLAIEPQFIAAAELGADPAVEYYTGSAWLAYDATQPPQLGSNGTLLVRVAIGNEQEASEEGPETFRLVASNMSGSESPANEGIGTIVDRNDGDWFAADNTTGVSSLPAGTLLDDDRQLNVSNVFDLNEASPYAVFIVEGVAGQAAFLSVDPFSEANLGPSPSFDYFDGSAWRAYDNTSPLLIGASGKLMVRVDISAEQDLQFEEIESFRVVATNTGGEQSSYFSGTALIKDDGTGSYFAADNTTGVSSLPPGTTLDDDRRFTVTDVTVNEGSPFVIFTVNFETSLPVDLSLAGAGGDGPEVAGNAADLGVSPAIQYFNGANWVNYNPLLGINSPAGKLLVRVAIGHEQDPGFDGPETFQLGVGLRGESARAYGTAIIRDDGSGDWYGGGNTTGTPDTPAGLLDDDRSLAVNDVEVNEASPYAVFTVTGATGQSVLPALGPNPTATLGTPALQFYDGTAWKDYDAATPPIIGSGGTLLVRVDISNEQDTIYEGAEIFTLIASNTGGTAVTGTATIKDNATGDWYDGDNTTGTPDSPAGPLDDDRPHGPVTVSTVTVNEGSPYAVFTVSAPVGQAILLSLIGARGDSPERAGGAADLGVSPALQYFDGTAWKRYDAGHPPVIGGSGKLIVRVAIAAEQETALDGPETFRLMAKCDAGESADTDGVATIVDDGSGNWYTGHDVTGEADAPPGVIYDDDRVLTVSSVKVNEGSPFAVFTVTGAPGQTVLLRLDGAGGDGPERPGGLADLGGGPALEYYDGGRWHSFDSAHPPRIGETGKLVVRVAIAAEQETALDGPETFRLVAANTGGGTAAGTATIFDDGTGGWYGSGNTTGTPHLPPGKILDDDRPLAVNSLTVNEASPYAVFTVTGAGGQAVILTLAGAGGDHPERPGGAADLGGPTLEIYDGNVWRVYDPDHPPAIGSSGTLLVRVAIGAEQESSVDGPETFTLSAANTGGAVSSGTATIVDDGTGGWHGAGNTTGTSHLPPGELLDDDRPLAVNSVTVNEASPYVVFTVTGAGGQAVILTLAGAGGDHPERPGGAADLGGPTLEIYDGTAWRVYDPAHPPALGVAGTLLVRIAIGAEQESSVDCPETFMLSATNTGGAASSGTATIVDDGTGGWHGAGNTTGTSHLPPDELLDDDRPLSVSNVTVDEASDFAVFTVSGAPGQYVSLAIDDTGTAELGDDPSIEYFDGEAWQAYDPSRPPMLNGHGRLPVRISITGEQDAVFEGPETFRLVATNTGNGSSASTQGIATIVDQPPVTADVANLHWLSRMRLWPASETDKWTLIPLAPAPALVTGIRIATEQGTEKGFEFIAQHVDQNRDPVAAAALSDLLHGTPAGAIHHRSPLLQPVEALDGRDLFVLAEPGRHVVPNTMCSIIELPRGMFGFAAHDAAISIGAQLASGGSLPSWLEADLDAGLITVTPPRGMAGTLVIVFTAQNGHGHLVRTELVIEIRRPDEAGPSAGTSHLSVAAAPLGAASGHHQSVEATGESGSPGGPAGLSRMLALSAAKRTAMDISVAFQEGL